jgi:gamma-butyrobetaine dioxygenase
MALRRSLFGTLFNAKNFPSLLAAKTRAATSSAISVVPKHCQGFKISDVKADEQRKILSVKWDDGKEGAFSFAWLRDSATTSEPDTFHYAPTLKARTLLLEKFDPEANPAKIDVVNGKGELKISWPDGTDTMFDSGWLRFRDLSDAKNRETRRSIYRFPITTWGSEEIKKVVDPPYDYAELQKDPKKFYDCLMDLTRYGLVVIKAPVQLGITQEMVKLLNHAHMTHFGYTWKVDIKPNPANLGYTTHKVGLHSDEPALQQTPEIMILHMVHQTEGEGGETELADSFRVAEQLKVEKPDVYKLLTTTPVEFLDEGYDADLGMSWDLYARHKILTLDDDGFLKKTFFSAHQRSWFLDMEPSKVQEMYRAIKTFNDYCYQPRNLFQRKLQNGEIIIYGNDRLLHGRTSFKGDEAQSRCIEGCYLGWDQIKSRIHVLRDQLNLPENQPSF